MSKKEFVNELKEDYKVNGQTRQFFKVTSKSGKADITFNDVKTMVHDLEENYKKKKYKDIHVVVRGMNIHRMRTLKGFYSDFDEQNFDDYYNADVEDVSKFTKFSQIQISAYFEKK